MSEPNPPSWWKYVGGRDADKKWSAFYASTLQGGGTFSGRERDFYLHAIKRFAEDSYAKPAHRPPEAVNFWLSCHYWLRASVASQKAAAIDTAALAGKLGIAKGHTPKSVQRHAKELQKPVMEFLSAVRGSIIERVPSELPELPSDDKVTGALIEWTARMVERAVR